ncbi:hypothetical protein [Flavobacterium sp.]|uniref:hypothetical protein n=1 Tax=Flavobacterium sp. TaxID=239 RepID=UPI0038FC2F66
MEIEIKQIITNEFFNGNINTVDLVNLEDFLTKKFAKKNFEDAMKNYKKSLIKVVLRNL